MRQEDKELLLKDLCARLPYRFVYLYTNAPYANNNPIVLTPVVISNLRNADSDLIIKPYLRPISSMTEEEKEEFNKLYYITQGSIVNAILNDGYSLAFTELTDWLNAHYFDYRGLIGKNLALDCTELHIYD